MLGVFVVLPQVSQDLKLRSRPYRSQSTLDGADSQAILDF